MEAVDKKQEEANLKMYADTIAKAEPKEKEVLVRVMVPPGFWWGPSPRLHKLYLEGEELLVPEHVWKNSDYHTSRKGVNGMVVRGVLERADLVKPAADNGYTDDVKILLERNQELERQLRAFTGQAPMEPLVVADEPRGKSKQKPREEI